MYYTNKRTIVPRPIECANECYDYAPSYRIDHAHEYYDCTLVEPVCIANEPDVDVHHDDDTINENDDEYH